MDKDTKDEKIKKLRFINDLMRKMLEQMRLNESRIGIHPVQFPDFVYEVV